MMDIYGIYMERLLRPEEYGRLLGLVSAERRSKVRKYRNPEDAHRGLIGEALVREIICGRFRVRNEEIAFTAGPYGKPQAANFPGFHFNLSHSGRWVVCAVDDQEVGVDIEEMKPLDLEMARYVFSEEQYRALLNKEEQARQAYFYDFWTLKESWVKLLGVGLSMALPEDPLPCYFKHYEVDSGYKLAVCSRSEAFPERVRLKGVDALYHLAEASHVL
ncbi:4'-phosphopantetheinyl transferase family protein [Paenibacillus macerans]|uniref:4'-phosphopantetheinyl transferase family protein n=1 Tax=Paenibacillus macerans TaxID=44252 RepID=UPI003D31BBDD